MMKKIITIFGIIIFIFGLAGVLFWYINKTSSQKLVTECDDRYDKSGSALSTARDICYVNAARKSQNNDLCNQIKDESVKKLCFVHVFYWDKSVAFCENDDQKDICLHVVSIKNNDKSICSKIDNDSIRKLCTQKNHGN